MVHDYTALFLQRDHSIQFKGDTYSIFSNKQVIGKVKETVPSSKSKMNQLLRVLNFYSAGSLEFEVLDREENIKGSIRKEKGWNKDFFIFSSNEEHYATIKPLVKVKSSTFTVTNAKGEDWLYATGGYGATDVSVIDSKTDRQIATIKRRSSIYETIKENLLHDDGYYIDTNHLERSVTLLLIAMGIAIEILYYHR